MRVLIGCEISGRVREAFRSRGHDAWSCDILPSDQPGQHIQGDIFGVIDDPWDMFLCFWPCTRLCNSGVRWLHERNLWADMRASAICFSKLLNCGIKKIAMENPIMHKYAKEIIRVGPSQIIQPWQFGHGETKSTCLWLKNLPPLLPTNIVLEREHRIHLMPRTDNRSKLRGLTFLGIAAAMAEQWG
jgi:hypothetical protein